MKKKPRLVKTVRNPIGSILKLVLFAAFLHISGMMNYFNLYGLGNHRPSNDFITLLNVACNFVGLYLGCSFSVLLFGGRKLPGIAKSILTLIISIVTMKLISAAMMWIYGILIELIGSIFIIFFILMILAFAIFGSTYLLLFGIAFFGLWDD